MFILDESDIDFYDDAPMMTADEFIEALYNLDSHMVAPVSYVQKSQTVDLHTYRGNINVRELARNVRQLSGTWPLTGESGVKHEGNTVIGVEYDVDGAVIMTRTDSGAIVAVSVS